MSSFPTKTSKNGDASKVEEDGKDGTQASIDNAASTQGAAVAPAPPAPKRQLPTEDSPGRSFKGSVRRHTLVLQRFNPGVVSEPGSGSGASPIRLLPHDQAPRRSSIPSSIRRGIPDANGTTVNVHYHEVSSPVSSWHKSITRMVTEKDSGQIVAKRMSRSVDQSPSSVRETVQNPWVQVSPMPPVSWDEDEDTDEEVQRRCTRLTFLYYPHLVCSSALRWIRRHPKLVISFASLIWLAYVIFVVIHNFAVHNRQFDLCNGGGLIVCTTSGIVAYIVLRKMADIYTNHNMEGLHEYCVGPWHWCHAMWERRYVRVIGYTLMFIVVVLLTHRGQYVSYHQGISVIGYFTIIFMAYLFSVNPEQINWRMVVQNLSLQFVTVYSMMVWDFGRLLLQCSAEKFSVFFEFSSEAAHVPFSTELPQMMAVELLCSLTITGCYMHILYYTGVLQGFLHKLGFVLEYITGATSIESICTALCALCGGIETSVMLEPYIVLLTLSELHLFVASGFASMTGVMLTSYMSQGIDQVSLMTTNFATCNGLIAVSKIIHPETQISVTTYQNLKFIDRDEYNVIDAAVNGATAVLKVLAYVIAGLIAMISLVNMGNAFVAWLLGNIGLYGMDALTIVAFLLRPLMFLLGVPWEFVNEVADLFTIKTLKNEYFAYMAFLELQKTRHFPHREEAVTTALLYGFSNIAHIGVTTAFLTALAPERRRDISCIVPKAMITGMLVNLLTASVIGIMVGQIADGEIPQNTTDSVRNAINATAESFSAKLNAFQIPNLLGF